MPKDGPMSRTPPPPPPTYVYTRYPGGRGRAGRHPLPTYVYTPTIADEGQRLRAYVFYTDSHGNRVKAMTWTSRPVRSNVTDIGFLLHVSPVDVDDLPDHRKQHGFDNLDFRFDNYRIPHRARDVAVRELPAYDVGSIRTGQYLVGADGSYTNLWEREIRFDE